MRLMGPITLSAPASAPTTVAAMSVAARVGRVMQPANRMGPPQARSTVASAEAMACARSADCFWLRALHADRMTRGMMRMFSLAAMLQLQILDALANAVGGNVGEQVAA